MDCGKTQPRMTELIGMLYWVHDSYFRNKDNRSSNLLCVIYPVVRWVELLIISSLLLLWILGRCTITRYFIQVKIKPRWWFSFIFLFFLLVQYIFFSINFQFSSVFISSLCWKNFEQITYKIRTTAAIPRATIYVVTSMLTYSGPITFPYIHNRRIKFKHNQHSMLGEIHNKQRKQTTLKIYIQLFSHHEGISKPW